MMRALLLIVSLSILGCTTAEDRPTDLLSREQFKNALLEAQLIEARVNQEMTIDKRQDMPVRQYYAEMFKAQGVTEEAFKKTFQWYAEHPAELKGVYEDILVELQKRVDQAAANSGH